MAVKNKFTFEKRQKELAKKKKKEEKRKRKMEENTRAEGDPGTELDQEE